jgi:hypothetical protein
MISYIRSYGQAATTDVFDGVTYWTDLQLKEICDGVGVFSTVKFVHFSDTIFIPDFLKHYKLDFPYTTLSLFNATLPDGTTVVLEGEYDVARGIITLDSALTEDYLTVDTYVVNIYEALAELWDRKAAQRAPYTTIDGGNNKMYLAQEYDHCIQQRDYYRRKTIKKWRR